MGQAMAKENENGQERTEQPTGKRLEDARSKGQVAKSPEVSTAFLFAASLLAFYFYIPQVSRDLSSLTAGYLVGLNEWNGTLDSFMVIFKRAVVQMGQLVLPIFAVFMVVGLGSNLIQVGFHVSTEPIMPKFSKLNPITGFKNKFMSIRSLQMLVKNLAIVAIVGWVAWRAIKRELPIYPPLMDASANVIVLTIFRSAMRLLWDTILVFAFIAAVDWIFQKRQHIRDLMMTKQEIKEEMKQSEGDPQIKSRIRSIQLQAARRRMMAEVPKAEVVITNPTHLAIALKYKRGEMSAPQVVAKGAGPVAARIKETARKAGVPIVENKPLARAIYKNVELNEFIPEELYKAVAEILAYVYRLKGAA